MIRNYLPQKARGAAILSLVMALAIVGILSGMMLGGGSLTVPPGAKPWPQQQTDRARDAVCAANRRTALTDLIYAQLDSNSPNMTTTLMQSTAGSMPTCPGDGCFFIYSQDVECTQHMVAFKFRDRLLGN